MERLTKVLGAAALVAFLAAGVAGAEAVRTVYWEPPDGDDVPAEVDPQPERVIDLAVCLDTSNSMDGLIDSARMKLWQIVTELARAKPTPRLRVGLLAYGSPSYGAETGWVRREIDLTDDLDSVYEKLMALKTNGGTEYVARVVGRAVDSLSWDARNDTLRLIFVAGNESADQDPQVSTREAARAAEARNVLVNTIYCGAEGSSDAAGYRRLASLAHGRFAAIDQSRGTYVVNTPYDAELRRLSSELNTTYIAYGARAEAGAASQTRQDANAAKLAPAVAAERASAKASSLYRNAAWDLVDASRGKDFDLEELEGDELPAEMRAMTAAEREAYVAEKARRRAEVQSEVRRITRLRAAHVAEETKKRASDAGDSFDVAVKETVRAQAVAAGYTF